MSEEFLHFSAEFTWVRMKRQTLHSPLNPRTTSGGKGAVVATPPPPKVFLIFSLDDKTSAPEVFCSCSFIPSAHFETTLVMVSNYGVTGYDVLSSRC